MDFRKWVAEHRNALIGAAVALDAFILGALIF